MANGARRSGGLGSLASHPHVTIDSATMPPLSANPSPLANKKFGKPPVMDSATLPPLTGQRAKTGWQKHPNLGGVVMPVATEINMDPAIADNRPAGTTVDNTFSWPLGWVKPGR